MNDSINAKVKPREEFIVTPENIWKEMERFDISSKTRFLRGELQIEMYFRNNYSVILAAWAKYLGYDFDGYVNILKNMDRLRQNMEYYFNNKLQEYLSKRPNYVNRIGIKRKVSFAFPHWEGMIDLVIYRIVSDIRISKLYRIPISILHKNKIIIHTVQGFHLNGDISPVWEVEMKLLAETLRELKDFEFMLQDPKSNLHLYRNARKRSKYESKTLPELFQVYFNTEESEEINSVASYYYPVTSKEYLKYHVIRPSPGYNSNQNMITFNDLKTGNLADDFYGPDLELTFFKLFTAPDR